MRTYSLLTNRFPDHTSVCVRVQDKDSGIVYATYSLGRTIAFEATAGGNRSRKSIACSALRRARAAWSYSRIGLNGELLAHSSFMETKTRPRLVRAANGESGSARRHDRGAGRANRARHRAETIERPPELPKDD